MTVWVFGSLMAIEVAILLPSYIKREHDLLVAQASKTKAALETGLINSQAKAAAEGAEPLSPALVSQTLAQLRRRSLIESYALFQADGKPVAALNTTLHLNPQEFDALRGRSVLNRWAQNSDMAILLEAADPPLYVAIRHDTQLIQAALNAYTLRMLSMILLIAVCVTLGTMLGMERLVIRPILVLKDDLIRAGNTVSQGLREEHFLTMRSHQNNELSEVIVAFQHMYEQIWQALDDQKAASLSEQQERERADQLSSTLAQLHQTQSQLLQSEKMAGLGQLVAGIAHEINNPVTFIHGNIQHVGNYTQELLSLISLYQLHYPTPVEDIRLAAADMDLDFISQDLADTLQSVKTGAQRIREIVLSLRNFSRLDESGVKPVDIHEGLESTLMLLQHRLKPSGSRPPIQVVKSYRMLPQVCCHAGQLNQVFMHILVNAIEVLMAQLEQQLPEMCEQNPGKITIRTTLLEKQQVEIAIANNGPAISPAVQSRIFEPFFTTKPIGQGTGMGLAISYQIVTLQHHGRLVCRSRPKGGTEFVIQLPVNAPSPAPLPAAANG